MTDYQLDDHHTSAAINDEKLRLIARLREERQRHIAALRDLPVRAVVHPESGWRVQDLLSHLAAWEREALAAIQAHSAGERYSLGDDFSTVEFNAATRARAEDHFPEQARIGWGMVRRDLQFAIHDVPAERFDEPFDYPWGSRGTVRALVERMLDHETIHIQEILDALRPASISEAE